MKKNYAKFVFNELKVLFDKDIKFFVSGNTVFYGISTDTRTLEPGNIFVGLKGENFDGSTLTTTAFEKGAAIAIINANYYQEHPDELKKYNIIAVENTLTALASLARFHRYKFDIPIVAIGGSNGKTTTKEMRSAVLQRKYNLLKTEGNYNNQIGVPLTLLQLDDSHTAAVIEIGTNEPGEIAVLTSIVRPTHGLITNIGREHLEQLTDLDGVEMEETFLFGHLKKQNGLAFINLDDKRLKKYPPFLDKNLVYGTDKEADVYATFEFNNKLQARLRIEDKSLKTDDNRTLEIALNVTGYAAAHNAIAAAAVGIQLDITPDDIIDALENFRQDDSHEYARMLLQITRGIKILNDCYNANPDSMRMALLTLNEMKTSGRKFAVLGDMRELGDASLTEHIALLEETAARIERIYLIGNEMLKAAKKSDIPSVKTFNTHEELAAALKKVLLEDDIILVKGSRGMKMEQIIKFLME